MDGAAAHSPPEVRKYLNFVFQNRMDSKIGTQGTLRSADYFFNGDALEEYFITHLFF